LALHSTLPRPHSSCQLILWRVLSPACTAGTTGEYLRAWLGRHEQAGDWSANTVHNCGRTVDRLFIPAYGDVPLDKLRASHVLAMLAWIDAANDRIEAARASDDADVRKSVAGLRTAGPSSKRRYLAVLASALTEAMAPARRAARGIVFRIMAQWLLALARRRDQRGGLRWRGYRFFFLITLMWTIAERHGYT
jgi:hypothetical protein